MGYSARGGSSSSYSARGGSSSSGGGHGHSIVHNLLSDVEDTAKGVPMGLVQLVKHPVGSAEAIGKATWHDWSPLIHGDAKTWWANFHAHPLAPLLDVSAFVTGGAGLAARGARALDAAGLAADGGRVAKLAEYSRPSTLKFQKFEKGKLVDNAPVMEKRLSTNPAARLRQEKLSKLADQLGQHLPSVFGRDARYARMDARTTALRRAALQAWMGTVVDAGRKLTGPDRHRYEEATMAHTVQNLHDFAYHADPTKAIPKGFRVLYKTHGKITRVARGRNVDFETDLKSLGKRFSFDPKGKKLTPDQLASAHTVGGKVRIVPEYTMNRMLQEGASSSKALKLLYKHPTTIWRMIQLGYRPAYFVNNFVGNHFMYAMGHDGVAGFRGYVDALRQAYGRREHIVAKSFDKAMAKVKGDHLNQFFGDQLGNTMSDTVLQELSGAHKLQKKFSRWSMFPITHAVADRFLRRASINAMLREEPAVQKLVKGGMKFDEAARKVLTDERAAGQSTIRVRVGQRVMDTMGDYHYLSGAEQKVRALVPFYAWDRHIARHIAQAFGEHGVRVDALSKLGDQGSVATEKLLGDVPHFLKGSIPLSVLGLHIDHPSRVALLTTQGINPYSTIPELVNSGARLVSRGGGSAGESVGGQLNPFLEGAAASIAGVNPLTGVPKKSGPLGVLGDTASAPFSKLQITSLLKALGNGTPQPKDPSKPFMYEKDPMQYLTSLLGIPIKQTNLDAAQRMKKKRRS